MPNEVKLLPVHCKGPNTPAMMLASKLADHGYAVPIAIVEAAIEATRPTTVVTDEVVERVAAAMRKQPALSPATKGYPSGDMVDFIMLARAAIEAMPAVVTGEQPEDLGDHALPCSASSPVSRSRPKAAAAIARRK